MFSATSKHVVGGLCQLALFLCLGFMLLSPNDRKLDVSGGALACRTESDSNTNPHKEVAHKPKDDDDSEDGVSVSLIVIASEHQSDSTILGQEILGTMSCHLSMEEILSKDDWRVEGRNMGLFPEQIQKEDPHKLDPSNLGIFVQKVAKKWCREMLTESNTATECNKHCWVNYEHFPVHLDMWQHSMVWGYLAKKMPLSMIVLERKVHDRWTAVAPKKGDPMPERFKYDHEAWFRLVRSYAGVMASTNSENAVLEMTFQDVTRNTVEATQNFVEENIMKHHTGPLRVSTMANPDEGAEEAMKEDW